MSLTLSKALGELKTLITVNLGDLKAYIWQMYYLDYSQELNSKIILNIIILYVYLQNDKCLILSVVI